MHMAQLMPLPLTVSCFSKIQIGFTFLVPAHPGSPGKGPLKGCVCVCVCVLLLRCTRGLQSATGLRTSTARRVRSRPLSTRPTSRASTRPTSPASSTGSSATPTTSFSCDFSSSTSKSPPPLPRRRRRPCTRLEHGRPGTNERTPSLYIFTMDAGLSSRVVSASDCGVRGPRFESRR